MRLVLARHGQTPANVGQVLDTVPPGPGLTALGESQAAALAEELAAEPVVAVYASTALRAQLTADPVAARHGLGVRVVDGVHEVFVGELEGRSDAESIARFREVDRAWHAGELDAAMPGGESARDVLARYLPVVGAIRAAHRDGVAVLVSHGGVLRIAAAAILRAGARSRGDGHADTDARTRGWYYLHNCGRIVLAADDGYAAGWRVEQWLPEPPGGPVADVPADPTGGDPEP